MQACLGLLCSPGDGQYNGRPGSAYELCEDVAYVEMKQRGGVEWSRIFEK